jgi:hypothetical protein
MGCSQIRVERTDVEPTEGAGHGFDEGDPAPERPNAHCDVPSVSRTVGQASGIIATAAALSWAVQTTHDLIQLLDYARGPANDGASAKVGKRLNDHCASPPPQDLSLSPPSHRLQVVLMHGMCAWRSGIPPHPPERVLATWPQSQTLGKRTPAPAKQQPKQQVVRRDDAAVRVSFRRLLDDIGCAASSRVVHALLGQFASHWAQRCVSSRWSPPVPNQQQRQHQNR